MIKLAAIFKDHAVLQRDKEFRIWGMTDCNEVGAEIVAEDGSVVAKNASFTINDGEFMLVFKPVEAGGPYTLRITGDSNNCENDSVTILDDIYMGDVWLAGGQSNMEFELKNSKNASEAIEESANDRIRFYNTPKVAWLGSELDKAESESKWELCGPETAGYQSAVAYYFALALTEESEGIMIGIVNCNWGGTSASCWVSREKLLEYPQTAQYIEEYDEITKSQTLEEHIKEFEEYEIYQAEFDRKVGEYYATAKNPSWDEAISLIGENKYPGPMGPRNWSRPCGLYETMLKKVAPYSLMGCIFYQGENDDNRPYSYKRLLTSLIEQWRADFCDEKLPVLIAQLPIFVNEGEDDYKNWPFIREAQAQVAEETDNGLAVILEVGEKYNIHPLDKETVGYRLAFQALHKVYGCYTKWDANGPEYDSSFVNGDALYIDLKCCESGLLVNGDDGFLENVRMMDYLPSDSGFEIAGEDGVYYNAKAQVLRGETVDEPQEGEADETLLTGGILTIKLTSDKVSVPKYARYFWKNYSKVRIFGANGMPLAPFRTSMKDGAVALGSRQGEIIDVFK